MMEKISLLKVGGCDNDAICLLTSRMVLLRETRG